MRLPRLVTLALVAATCRGAEPPGAAATGTYTIAATVTTANPAFKPVPGPYTSTQVVTLSDATPGAAI